MTPVGARDRDLTPWTDRDHQTGYGGARDYLGFLKEELLPTIETRYRADPHRRVLSGQSYGGLFGLWVAMTTPELFNSYILTSPSIWYGNHGLLDLEKSYGGAHKDLNAKIYLAAGQHERGTAADIHQLAAQLRSRHFHSLQLKEDVIEDGYHETTFGTGLTRGLQWLFLGPGE